ncbi:MAG: hypothetical protein A3B90_02515 [Candidatus Magasanikbacteria bacterium RIFCSPHIGHO2_02_FULL_41_13]|uniref:HTH cro/C1-type domain-containing protein n=1 Tax=Candidatus Magasanikbacteria bacterium RIFCSPHIGHO2_02_FULL_41_13 TaxID=1798676 RepID=A0A1F6M3P0_9BACT|nr:MAG: hypothetical protein A3B90_02515 [Candidatus Magasanikbacteria bacterium RIFCSPHIGHO2_02_FULL_41_13]
MNFQTKNLEKKEPTCVQLKLLREAKGITLQDMSERLKMSKCHIVALEECRCEDLPFAPIYKKKMVKQYCHIIDADYATLVHQFVEEELEEQILSQEKLPQSQSRLSRWNHLPFVFRLTAISAIALIFFGYLGLQVKKIIDPPELNLFSPINGMVTAESNLQIKGQTDKEVKVMINGKEIKNSEQGIFDETLALSPGVNTLVISAEKKHGKTTTETRYVVRENKAEFSLTPSPTVNN